HSASSSAVTSVSVRTEAVPTSAAASGSISAKFVESIFYFSSKPKMPGLRAPRDGPRRRGTQPVAPFVPLLPVTGLCVCGRMRVRARAEHNRRERDKRDRSFRTNLLEQFIGIPHVVTHTQSAVAALPFATDLFRHTESTLGKGLRKG